MKRDDHARVRVDTAAVFILRKNKSFPITVKAFSHSRSLPRAFWPSLPAKPVHEKQVALGTHDLIDRIWTKGTANQMKRLKSLRV